MTPRTGRPPVENPHRNGVSIRLTDEDIAGLKLAAAKAGMGIGPWMRAEVRKAIKRANKA